MAYLSNTRHKSSEDTADVLTSPIPLPHKSSPQETSALIGVRPLTKASNMALSNPTPRCLFFDVFGTCVDWRSTVTKALWNATRTVLSNPAASLASRIRMQASDMTYEQWGDFAQEWRNSYLKFTRALAADSNMEWKTVDQHHHDSLREILQGRGLMYENEMGTMVGLWNEDEIKDLSLIWHRLDPWQDTVRGIQELNRLFWTCTLSNGNISLLKDMQEHAGMEFTHTFSAEMFNSYKPNPAVYLGAAKKMGLEPNECAMVAAHLGDLRGAKKCGFQTIYVERPQEEREDQPADKNGGFVDLWVDINQEGFITAAEKLGIQIDRQRRRSGSAPPRTTDPAAIPH